MTLHQEQALRRYREMAEHVRDVIEIDSPLPMVRYWDRMLGRYNERTNVIELPTPEALAYYHGEEPIDECMGDHEFLFLHELAHWGTDGEGHTPRMYAFLFCLAKLFNYRMRKVRAVELEYKPRAAKSGYRLYLRTRAS